MFIICISLFLYANMSFLAIDSWINVMYFDFCMQFWVFWVKIRESMLSVHLWMESFAFISLSHLSHQVFWKTWFNLLFSKNIVKWILDLECINFFPCQDFLVGFDRLSFFGEDFGKFYSGTSYCIYCIDTLVATLWWSPNF